ncbi:MAG: hypothetical protein CVT83_00060 [Alphaproteobacteria bacterium HGW-Alphaproteobacteria-5]|nr:MAG: hypothetical protein CVT83_00060 [Alphaproteobacteria bacterium HGW-Alphaproteobacteria-5]
MAIGMLQTTWLLARDHGDVVAGVGVNGPLDGAAWDIEIVPTFVDGHGTYTSAITNISTALTVRGRDTTFFAEYYRNGFGMKARHYALVDLPAPPQDRLIRGQVFNTGRDYLAGAKIPIGPSRTEFGGLPLAGNSRPFLEQPHRAYMQLRQYF